MIALNNRPAGGGGGSGLTPQQIQSLTEIGSSLEETKRILNDLKYVKGWGSAGISWTVGPFVLECKILFWIFFRRNVVSAQSGSAATQDLKEYIRNVIGKLC